MKKKPTKEAKAVKYSGTEFGAVLEDIHKDVKTIAEGHDGIVKRLENIEIEVHGNSRRLDMLELRTGVVKDKVGRLEDAVSLLSKELKDAKGELKNELKETRNDLKNDIKNLGDRLTSVESGRS